jgi:hypothetical protein
LELDGVPYSDPGAFDLDFESPTPKGFYTGGTGYLVRLESTVFHSGRQSLLMKYLSSELGRLRAVLGDPYFGVATGSFPVQIVAGKRVRYSGHIKTEGITQGWARLWWL